VAYSYSIDDPAKNQKRMMAFVLVVILHAFFLWLIASGLGARLVETVVGPVETKIIDELPDKETPPPPPPDIDQPPPYVPPPEVSIDHALGTAESPAN
jgi:protein TonB